MTQIRHLIDIMNTFTLFEDAKHFDVNAFLDRVASVKRLIARGATEGERAAASLALNRLLGRGAAELPYLSDVDRKRMLAMQELAEPESDDALPPKKSYAWVDLKRMPLGGEIYIFRGQGSLQAEMTYRSGKYEVTFKTPDAKEVKYAEHKFHYSAHEKAYVCRVPELDQQQAISLLKKYRLKFTYSGTSAF